MLPSTLFKQANKLKIAFCFLFFTFNSFGSSINETLIETAIILNFHSSNEENYQKSRRLSQSYSEINPAMSTDINNSMSGFDQTINSVGVETSFKNIFENYPNEKKLDAVDYATDYLVQNKDTFGLSNENFGYALQSILKSLIGTSNIGELEGYYAELPLRIFQNLIPNAINQWGHTSTEWIELLSKTIIDSISNSGLAANEKNSLYEISIKSSFSGILNLLKSANTNANGFYSGIKPIDDSTLSDATMLFDGAHKEFKKFNPQKTYIINHLARGLTDAIFKNIDPNKDVKSEFDAYAKILGENAIEGTLEFFNSINDGGDYSLFAFEVSRVVANGLSHEAVLVSTAQPNYKTLSLPSHAAEVMARSVSSKSIEYLLEKNINYDLTKMAQAVSFGSAQGSQLASVSEKALDYPDNWEIFSRKEIAKKSSEGSSNGSVDTAAKLYISPDKYEGNPKPDGRTNWNEILEIAKGSSMGSLTANTAMSIYFPTERQSIINYSAHGSAYGSVSADNLNIILPEPKNPTSEIKVDIARATANGASTGATFEVVALLGAKPDLDSSDTDSLKTIEAATYGTTFGAIQAGTESLNSDALLLKQASKQGATSGSLNGIGLGLGKGLNEAVNVDLNSKTAILQTISTTNSVASTNASRSIATKSIKTSASDMLLLMRKFNISPKFTNPTRIYQNTDTDINNADLPSAQTPIEYASPI